MEDDIKYFFLAHKKRKWNKVMLREQILYVMASCIRKLPSVLAVSMRKVHLASEGLRIISMTCFEDFNFFFTGLQFHCLLLSTEWRMHALNWCRLPPCWKPTHTLFLLGITSSMAPGASCPGPLTCSWLLTRPRYSFTHSFIYYLFYLINLLTSRSLEVRMQILLQERNINQLTLLDIICFSGLVCSTTPNPCSDFLHFAGCGFAPWLQKHVWI